MKERYIATVDFGTYKIALSVARISGDGTEIIYYRETASDGVRFSCVMNPQKASVALRKALDEAESELGIKIIQVVVGLPRYRILQESASGAIERQDPESCITQEEIDQIKYNAQETYELSDSSQEVIYGIFPQAFSTDYEFSLPEKDVVGMVSDKIEGSFRIFIGDKRYVSNIDTMLAKAGVSATHKFFTPLTSASAVLNQEERDNGVALFEIGGGVSSVSIFQDGVLRYYASIPFGGCTVTGDIKHECSFRESLSENIKQGYGICMPDKLQNMSDKIIQVNYLENGTSKQIGVKYLSEIITSRYREIFEALLYHVNQSGYEERLRSGIVLTGGGASLTNAANFLKQMSGYNVRIGLPRCKGMILAGCDEIKDTGATATVGMILYAREDESLNCSTEYVAPARKFIRTEKEKPVEEVPAPVDTVFSPTPATPEEIKKVSERKAEKKSLNMSWTKKLGRAYERAVGSLFDQAASRDDNN